MRYDVRLCPVFVCFILSLQMCYARSPHDTHTTSHVNVQMMCHKVHVYLYIAVGVPWSSMGFEHMWPRCGRGVGMRTMLNRRS
mgnify:CR=1 FL=1